MDSESAHLRTSSSVDQESGELTFTLLGPLEVRKNGINYAPTAPKILHLLAMLLMRAGRPVPTDLIIHELWSDGPPRSVRRTVQTYVYQLRRCIEENGLAPNAEHVLATKSPGYVMWVEPAQIDVFTFYELCRQGRELMDASRYGEAAGTFRAALSLWAGPPVANVSCGPVLSAYVVDLQEQRRNAQYLRIQADIESGLHRELIGELRSLVAANPLDEGLHVQLMRVLSRSVRRLEALEVYRDLRATLNEELGLEPCDELQTLHHELLCAGDAAA